MSLTEPVVAVEGVCDGEVATARGAATRFAALGFADCGRSVAMVAVPDKAGDAVDAKRITDAIVSILQSSYSMPGDVLPPSERLPARPTITAATNLTYKSLQELTRDVPSLGFKARYFQQTQQDPPRMNQCLNGMKRCRSACNESNDRRLFGVRVSIENSTVLHCTPWVVSTAALGWCQRRA